jgi:transcriptional regulator with XRE-family HTH domain
MKIFAKAIWNRRRELKLSRDYVSEECGISSQTLYKWETNATSPDADEIFRLSKALKCPVAQFFNESMLPKEVFSNPDAVLEAIRELRKTGQLQLEEVVAAGMTEEQIPSKNKGRRR